MSEQLLNILKLCLMALIYLFLARVIRAVLAELRTPEAGPRRQRGAVPVPAGAPVGPAAAIPAPDAPRRRPRGRRGGLTELVVVEPTATAGTRYPLAPEITVGRAPGCYVTIDDTFVSQVHARVFERDSTYLVEDLGSTNGTLLNRAKVTAPVTMKKGDRLQVGNTVLEVR